MSDTQLYSNVPASGNAISEMVIEILAARELELQDKVAALQAYVASLQEDVATYRDMTVTCLDALSAAKLRAFRDRRRMRKLRRSVRAAERGHPASPTWSARRPRLGVAA